MGKRLEDFIGRTQTLWIGLLFLAVYFYGSYFMALVNTQVLGFGWQVTSALMSIIVSFIFVLFFFLHMQSIVRRKTRTQVIFTDGDTETRFFEGEQVEVVVAQSQHKTLVYGHGYRDEDPDKPKEEEPISKPLFAVVFFIIFVLPAVGLWATTILPDWRLRLVAMLVWYAGYVVWRWNFAREVKRRDEEWEIRIADTRIL